MPISPEKMKLYPGGSIRSKEWLAIRERVRKRAGDRCEQCGVPNSTWICRDEDSGWVEVLGIEKGAVKIVCTVAHMDGGLTNHSFGNLGFLCQRCHNRLDAHNRQLNARITRHAKKAAGDLFEGKE